MAQTKKGSLLEVTCNAFTGFVVAWILTHYLFPTWFNLDLTINQSWHITLIYTVVSMIRTFIWRRIFNHFILYKGI